MTTIDNYTVYNDRMRQSLWDKAFFMDKIPGARLIVDFGCADGSLIRFFSALFPSLYYIGYDIDPHMIERANAVREENTWFFSRPEQVLKKVQELNVDGRSIALNFSSVLHEIFHYGADTAQISRFIRALQPEYIVIRDMMYDCRQEDALASEKAVERVRQSLPAAQIADFEQAFGSVTLQKNLIHLLLKYKYTENWPRECPENYFAVSMPRLFELADPDHQFRVLLKHHYILPWCRYEMETQLGIDPGQAFTTHIALILGRKSPNKLAVLPRLTQ